MEMPQHAPLMEDEFNESSANPFAMALAVLGIVLGGAGLYFGLTANQRLTSISATLEEGSSSAAALTQQIDGFQQQIAELEAEAEELRQALKRANAYGNGRDKAIKQLEAAINDNRKRMGEYGEELSELASSGVRVAPAPAAPTSTSSTTTASDSSGTVTATAGSATTYRIQSGDTLGRVASAKGISLQDLLDANPGIEPTRLSIGQTINVPAN